MDSNGKLHYREGYEFENGKYTYKFLLSIDDTAIYGTFDFDFTIYGVLMGKAQVIGEKGRENIFIVDVLVFTDTHIDFTKNCVGKVFIDLKAKKIDMEIQRSKHPYFYYEPIEK